MSADDLRTRDATKNAYDSDAPQKLIDFMSRDWIDVPLRAGAHPQLTRLASRRDDLSRAYPGCYIVIDAGAEKVRNNDCMYRFRPTSDFAYLMGDGEAGSVLVMEPDGASHRTVLFAPEHNRGKAEFFTDRVHGELWVGRHRGLDESQIYFGVDRCRPLAETSTHLNDLRIAGHKIVDQHELSTHLSEMRLIKDEYEVAEIRKACEISKRGFEDVIRLFKTATTEREFEAAFWRRARMEANDVGYLTIAASGHNACTLHWTKNSAKLQTEKLLLLDAGVECDSLYTADITRTLPLSGKFSPEQRAVYEIVYEAQRVAIDAVAPGADFLEPNRRAMHVLAEGLIDLGILTCLLEEAMAPENQFYRRYSLHNVSHMLGLDVHDCATARAENYRYGSLREGMVLTVEPGLYFQPDDATVSEKFRGIGVRIEDDIHVTANGRENLSSILPSKLSEVERWISELRG